MDSINEQGAKLVNVHREPTPFDGWADMVIQDKLIGSLLQETDKILNL